MTVHLMMVIQLRLPAVIYPAIRHMCVCVCVCVCYLGPPISKMMMAYEMMGHLM